MACALARDEADQLELAAAQCLAAPQVSIVRGDCFVGSTPFASWDAEAEVMQGHLHHLICSIYQCLPALNISCTGTNRAAAF